MDTTTTNTFPARTHMLEAYDHRVLRYRAWMRTDVPATVTFDLPGNPKKAVEPMTLDPRNPLQLDLRRPRTRESAPTAARGS